MHIAEGDAKTIGFFLLRFRAPELERPFRMWFYPLPGVIAIAGWLYVLGTASRKSLLFAFGVLLVGTAAYLSRSWKRGEWPFGKPVAVGSRE